MGALLRRRRRSRRPTPPRSARSIDARPVSPTALICDLPGAASPAPRSHRRRVIRREEPFGVVLEIEEAAAAAEPVRRAVVLDREVGLSSSRPPSRRRGRSRWSCGICLRRLAVNSATARHRPARRMSAGTIRPCRTRRRSRASLEDERDRLRGEIGETIVAPGQMTYGSQAAAATQVFEQQRDLALRDRTDAAARRSSTRRSPVSTTARSGRASAAAGRSRRSGSRRCRGRPAASIASGSSPATR